MDLFRTEKLTPEITRITDVSGTHCYLVEGSRKAALIDTGCGLGDLGSLVCSLTALPVLCLLTHGHVDHAMGSGCFAQVWLHPADTELYRQHCLPQMRMGYVKGSAMSGGDPALIAQVTEADLQPVHAPEVFQPLQVGDRFDLGGLTVEILPGRGHTQGSVTMLIPELRTLVLGDACNNFTFLFDAFSSSVTDYRAMLLELRQQTAGRFDRVLLCHGPGFPAPLDMIDSVISVCDDLLAGRSDKIPFRGVGGEPALIAKTMDFRRFCRADGGSGNIVYNPDHL